MAKGLGKDTANYRPGLFRDYRHKSASWRHDRARPVYHVMRDALDSVASSVKYICIRLAFATTSRFTVRRRAPAKAAAVERANRTPPAPPRTPSRHRLQRRRTRRVEAAGPVSHQPHRRSEARAPAGTAEGRRGRAAPALPEPASWRRLRRPRTAHLGSDQPQRLRRDAGLAARAARPGVRLLRPPLHRAPDDARPRDAAPRTDGLRPA